MTRRRLIRGNARRGRPRQLAFLMGTSIALADGASATLTGTADRRALLGALFIEANVRDGMPAASRRLYGIHVTGITINGRNARIATGSIPANLAFGEFAQRAGADGGWSLGVVEQGGDARVALTNDSGAAGDVYAGFRARTVD